MKTIIALFMLFQSSAFATGFTATFSSGMVGIGAQITVNETARTLTINDPSVFFTVLTKYASITGDASMAKYSAYGICYLYGKSLLGYTVVTNPTRFSVGMDTRGSYYNYTTAGVYKLATVTCTY